MPSTNSLQWNIGNGGGNLPSLWASFTAVPFRSVGVRREREGDQTTLMIMENFFWRREREALYIKIIKVTVPNFKFL